MITLHQQGDLARLTLDRPERRNALTVAMWRALPGLIADCVASPAKIVILSGAGGHFAAGADLAEFADTYRTPESAGEFAGIMGAAMEALATCPKPVIAQITGACIGGGCGLALACDIRLASSDARLGLSPGKLGLAYTLADTKRLSDAVGLSRARMLLYTGRIVTAEEALRFGLVDEVAERDALPARVLSLAQDIAASSQVSVRIAKATLLRIANGTDADTDETSGWYRNAMAGADFAEGRAAFLEKRTAKFPTR